jgi:hypothetical protein
VTISRAFYITFGCALLIAAMHFLLTEESDFGTVLVVAGYVCLVGLGFLLGNQSQPYRTAFANTWPFVLMWLVMGIACIQVQLSGLPHWSAADIRTAQWGYVIASLLYLPVAFVASAVGVWLARRFPRFQIGGSGAA